MKHLNLIFALIFTFLFSGIVSAQDDKKDKKKAEITICGELRPRTEFNHGLKAPMLKWNIQDEYKQKGSLATTQRSRFGIHYKTNKVKFGIQLQDVRMWGGQPQLVKNEANSISVHQAWAEFYFTKEFSLKAGRMELAYDDHRILGNVGWAQQARSHDLALFKYEGDIKVHLGLAYHGGPYAGPDAYKAMQFLWVNGKAADFGYSILFLNNGKTENGVWANDLTTGDFTGVAERNAYSQTVGGHFTYKLGDLKLGLNAYYQMGKKSKMWVDTKSLPAGVTAESIGMADKKGQGQKIAAYNFAFDAMYKVSDDLKVGFAYENLSGNDLTNADRKDENAFAPLYGTNHKFNGWMDYFYVGNHGSNVGLQDINFKAIYKNGPFFVKFIPHYFMAANKSKYTDLDGNEQDLKALGTEIDIWAGYNLVPKVASIQFGYSHMLATEGMYALKGVGLSSNNGMGTNNWFWAMLVLKPKFMMSK